jgi:hypothetical protein
MGQQLMAGGVAHLHHQTIDVLTTRGNRVAVSALRFAHQPDTPAGVCVVPPEGRHGAPVQLFWLDVAAARQLARNIFECAQAAQDFNATHLHSETHDDHQALSSAIGAMVSGFGSLQP